MLRYLFNFFFPFLALTFAAGAPAIIEGGGEGGGEGDLGSGGEGEGAGEGEGSGEGEGESESDLPEFDDAEDIESEGKGEGEGESDPNAIVDLGDGRRAPAKFKKLFDLAKKAGLEKEAKQLYFAQQRLAKVIPGGIGAAIELAQNVERLGGLEAIEQLQTDAESYAADAELFEKGDPRWVETGFEESPESALKMFAHSLDYVAEKHPEHYDHLMAKVIVNDLGNLDVRALYSKLASLKDDPQAKELAKQLADYYNSRLEASRKAPEKKPDAQSSALKKREDELGKKEMNLRQAEARTEIKPTLQNQIGSTIRAEAKARGLDLQKLAKAYESEYLDLVTKIHRRVNELAVKDNRFTRNFHAHLVKGEIKKAVKLANDKHNAIIGDAVRETFEKSGIFRGKRGSGQGADKDKDKQRAAGGQGAGEGWTRVKDRPKNSEINWSRTTQAMQLDGKYVLNDGKKVVVQY